jgi:hypothetical protein
MKKIILALLLGFITSAVSAQHHYEIDLNKIDKDILPVKMTLSNPPKSDQITYSFPATVPGTYDTQDFGRFVVSMIAKTADGKNLTVKNKEGIDRMPMSISEDGGKTWKYAASEFPPIDGGQRMVLKRLKEGPLLLISFTNHPYRLKNNLKGMTFTATDGSEFTGYGMYAALSFDEGKSWPVKKLLTDGKERFLDGGAWTGYFEMNATNAEPRGYLAMIQTPDNLINLVSSKNYYRFNLAWLLDNPAFKKYVEFIR